MADAEEGPTPSPHESRTASSHTPGRSAGTPTVEPAAAATSAAVPAAQEAADRHHEQLIQQDRLTAVVGAGLWGITAAKISPAMTTCTDVQTLLGLLAILAVALAWPSLHPASYRRRRVPALAALRLFLITLPVNYDTSVFDALAPSFDSGRLAWLINLSHLVMGTHIMMLVFPAIGWRLPPRAHLPVQALSVGLLMTFGIHPHCRSKLLSSPEIVSLVGGVHTAANLVAGAFMPAASLANPKDPYSQTVALLLFWWVNAGFLLPTLLLLWPLRDTEARTAGTAGGEANGQGPLARGCRVHRWTEAAAAGAVRAADWLQEGLCSLLLAAQDLGLQPAGQVGQAGAAPAALQWHAVRAPLAARWFVLLQSIWLACCAAAPLYGGPGQT